MNRKRPQVAFCVAVLGTCLLPLLLEAMHFEKEDEHKKRKPVDKRLSSCLNSHDGGSIVVLQLKKRPSKPETRPSAPGNGAYDFHKIVGCLQTYGYLKRSPKQPNPPKGSACPDIQPKCYPVSCVDGHWKCGPFPIQPSKQPAIK